MDGLFAGSESQEDPAAARSDTTAAAGEAQGSDDAPPAEQPKASDGSQAQAEGPGSAAAAVLRLTLWAPPFFFFVGTRWSYGSEKARQWLSFDSWNTAPPV